LRPNILRVVFQVVAVRCLRGIVGVEGIKQLRTLPSAGKRKGAANGRKSQGFFIFSVGVEDFCFGRSILCINRDEFCASGGNRFELYFCFRNDFGPMFER
jgi:hypothetical protein